jgi:hypothetical protein
MPSYSSPELSTVDYWVSTPASGIYASALNRGGVVRLTDRLRLTAVCLKVLTCRNWRVKTVPDHFKVHALTA